MRRWTEVREKLVQSDEARAAYRAAAASFAFGEAVRELRERSGLTQKQLAQRLSTTQPTIARLEAGGVDVRLSTVTRLAGVLGADLLERFQQKCDEVERWGATAAPA